MTRTVEPDVGQVWETRRHFHGRPLRRRVIGVIDGVVVYRENPRPFNPGEPGACRISDFHAECARIITCPVCHEPAETDSDPCPTCWGKADTGELL